jgi:hypothetical protein
MSKPFLALAPGTITSLPGQLGVYQLADDDLRVVYIGFAGGNSLFGLRGELQRALEDPQNSASHFRCEVTQQYASRYLELLMLHVADHGSLPPGNRASPPPGLGRLSPL